MRFKELKVWGDEVLFEIANFTLAHPPVLLAVTGPVDSLVTHSSCLVL